MQRQRLSDFDRILTYASDIGAGMLKSGAEINRVEDTISRICGHFSAKNINVFATPYNIVTTAEFNDLTYTQSRRVITMSYNLQSLAMYNELSRQICNNIVSVGEIEGEINKIKNSNGAGEARISLSYFFIALGFCIFFGGSIKDSLVAGLIAVIMRMVEAILRKININRFIVISACGFTVAFLSTFAERTGCGLSGEHISIGIIMILISGLLFTNSFKEMFMDNILTGAIKLFEALFIAMAICIGFALASILN